MRRIWASKIVVTCPTGLAGVFRSRVYDLTPDVFANCAHLELGFYLITLMFHFSIFISGHGRSAQVSLRTA